MPTSFDLVATTKIESGEPIAMHAQVGNAIVGKQFRLDIREYRWNEPIVSSGAINYVHILSAFADSRSQTACRYQHRRRQVPVGNIILIPPNKKIVFESPPGYQRFLSLMLDPAMVAVMSSIEWGVEQLERTLDIRHPSINALMSRMFTEVANPAFASDVVVEGTSLLLAAELCRFFGVGQVEEKTIYSLSKRQLRLITEQINDRQFAPSLAELASSCGISRRHLTRSFKQTTGLTIGEFVLDQQLTRAKVLLSQESLQIKQVAYRCGFHSSTAFSAAFRRATRLTPSQFRARADCDREALPHEQRQPHGALRDDR